MSKRTSFSIGGLVVGVTLGACGPSPNREADANGTTGRADARAGSTNNSCNADGVDLIYVLDQDFRLYSFDPMLLMGGQDPFAAKGILSCPTQRPPVEPFLEVSPMSMSVDRAGVAWVHYTSGEIFNVPLNDLADCQASGYTPLQQGFTVFGMGFSADAPGSEEETLYVASTTGDFFPETRLGAIDPTSKQLTPVGPLNFATGTGSELSGTGAAELFAFEPGIAASVVQQINKSNGNAEGPQMTVPRGVGLANSVAYAFAQWGGRFYIFFSTDNDWRIHEVIKDTGAHTVVMNNLPYRIVGAGVSTCAPVVID